MGFDARTVDRQDFWEFAAQWKAFRNANSPDQGPKAPTSEEFERAVAISNTLH